VNTDLLERVIRHEGFKDKPFLDSEGVATIGHGLTFLTEEESKRIVANRLENFEMRLMNVEPDFFNALNQPEVLNILIEMSYQLGLQGCLNFRKMWAALKTKDYPTAADEMIDSQWHQQTPERCEEMAGIIRSLGNGIV